MENKRFKITKLLALAATLILCILTIVLPVSARPMLGYVTYGSSDTPVQTFAGSGTIFIPADVDVVHICMPNVNAGSFLVTTGYADTQFSYTATFWGLSGSSSQLGASYVGPSYSFSTVPTVAPITSQLTDLDIRIYRPSGTSNDLLGTWILSSVISDTSVFSNGYGTFSVGGLISNDSQTLRFNQLRWSKSSSGFNLVADVPDWGEESVISNNNNVYGGTITFDDVSSGEPQQLLAFFQDNAEKEGSSGWSISLTLPSDSSVLPSYLDNLRNKIVTLTNSLDAEENGGMFSWIVNSLNGFFSLDIGIGIPLGGVLGAIISLLVVIALLREFAGG